MSKRVLQVLTVMNRGGAETMVMNYYRNIDRQRVQFDFLVHRDFQGDFDSEIQELGGRIFRAFPIRPWNYGQYKKWLDAFFAEHNEFSVVHSHIQENSGFVLSAAKKFGIPYRIAHSHTAPDRFDYKMIFRQYAKRYLMDSVTHRMACGEKAGRWLFKDQGFKVLPNAIDTDSFTFKPEVREEKRKELGITGKLVIGNVARFNPAKNQSFAIDVFKYIKRVRKDAVLLLVGTGPSEERIANIVKQEGLSDSVLFLGVRSDVNELLQAMDVFLFPSKLEGLPVSLIEAQATGLPCVVSDIITSEVEVTDLLKFVSLDEKPEIWAQKVLNSVSTTRGAKTEQIKLSNYDIVSNARWLEEFYLGQ